jgi:branched-chain amino acid transport system substrate-binding protein
MANKLQRYVSRRRFVGGSAATGAGLFGLAIAGCSSSNNNNSKPAGNVANAVATRVASAAAAAGSATVTRPASPAAGSPGAPRAASPAAAASPSTVKLSGDVGMGFISSFTGPLAPIYAPFVNGAKLAIQEINDKGGIGGAKLTLEQADDQSNPANVAAAALGLADKKVHFCIGPIGSNAISASPALNQAKIIQAGYSDNPGLADVSKFKYSFRFVWSADQSSKLLVDYFTKQLNVDKIAVLGENTVYGQTDLPTTEKYMQTVNLKPTLSEYFPSGTSDFTPLLRRVQDSGAKAIVWWTQGGPEGATILKNLNDLKMDIYIGGIGLIAGAVKGQVPDSLLDKAFSVYWKNATYSDAQPTPQNYKDFVAKLNANNGLGDLGSGGTAPFYDFVYYMKAAIEGTGGTDSEKIVAYMESTPYKGVVATYNGISNKDHSTTAQDQISLGVLSSFNAAAPETKVFLKRAQGL